MPIEIEELVIRAKVTVSEMPKSKEDLRLQKQELLQECVAEVMRVMKIKNQP